MSESVSTDLCLPSPPAWLGDAAIYSTLLWGACALLVTAYAPHSLLAALCLGLWIPLNAGLIVWSRSTAEDAARYQDRQEEDDQRYHRDETKRSQA